MIKLLTELREPTAKSKIADCDWETLLKYIRKETIFAIDTETTGLDPFKSKVIMLQIGTPEYQFIIDTRELDTKEPFWLELVGILESDKITKVLVNSKFDYKMLRVNYGIQLTNIKDCMLQEKVLTTGIFGARANLKLLAKKYLNMDLKKGDAAKEFLTIGKNPFTTDQLIYGALDVKIPLTINKFQEEILEKENLTVCAKLENSFVIAMAEMEINGFKLNKDMWAQLAQETTVELLNSQKLLDSYVANHPNLKKFVQHSLFEDGRKVSIEWSSSKQVIPVFKALGIDTKILDKDASKKDENAENYKDTVEAKHLLKYKKDFEIIPLYINYKVLEKKVTTYGMEFLANINSVTNRIHSDYWQILDTGRMSSSNPNLQNIPKDDKYRSCFVPEKGNKFIICDYSTQEIRILADASNEPVLIDFFINGKGDVHSLTASKMFKEEFKGAKETPHLRQLAKIINFGIAYGMSGYKLANDFNISLEDANKFIEKFFQEYPELPKYFSKAQKNALQNQYILIDSFTGRRSYCTDCKELLEIQNYINKTPKKDIQKNVWSRYYIIKGSIERAAMNYPIQGTAASMTKTAAIMFHNFLKSHNLMNKVKIVNIVHDEIVVECFEEMVKDIAPILQEKMEKAGQYFCKKVPMEAQYNIVDFWTH